MFDLRFLFALCCLGIIFLGGCTQVPPPHAALQAEIRHTAQEFYVAVAAKDARMVYHYMDDELKSEISFEAFQDYFNVNYSRFLTFATALRDEMGAQPPVISAQMDQDPCAQMQVITDSAGEWKVSKLPTRAATETPTQRKAALIQALRTPQFLAVIEDYAHRHPEIERTKVRQLKRILAFEDIPVLNVRFVATDAIIDFGSAQQIRMTCEPQGWRLVSCSL